MVRIRTGRPCRQQVCLSRPLHMISEVYAVETHVNTLHVKHASLRVLAHLAGAPPMPAEIGFRLQNLQVQGCLAAHVVLVQHMRNGA